MIAIGCDHAGLELKTKILAFLEIKSIEYKDYGTYSKDSCDYPLFAKSVCDAVVTNAAQYGILICGTGIGMSIAANKIKGIRAACCSDSYSAKMTRRHNDANVLCMGARVIGEEIAYEITEAFLNNEFEGGKHLKRVNMFMEYED